MINAWKCKKLGDICSFQNGRAFKKSDWSENGLPIIRIANLNSENALFNYYNGVYDKKILIEKDDLLFSWSGTIGSSFGPHLWKKENALLNQHIFKVNLSENLSKKFVYYLLLNITSELEKQTRGAVGLVHVNKSTLVDFEVDIPSLTEQKQIVETLDKAFEKIDKAIANIERNIENAEELFQSKLSQIFSKTDGGFEMTWEDVVDIRNGKSQKEVITEDGKYPIIGSSGKPIGYAKEYLCEANSTIIGRKGTINNPILIENNYWNVDTAFGLHSKDGLHYKFLFYFCKSFDFTKLDKGSGRPSLVKSDLLKIKMPVPKTIEQKEIVETLDNLNNNVKAIISVYKKELVNLEELKKSILEKAFKGELTSAA